MVVVIGNKSGINRMSENRGDHQTKWLRGLSIYPRPEGSKFIEIGTLRPFHHEGCGTGFSEIAQSGSEIALVCHSYF
jgi:hypothetical protein